MFVPLIELCKICRIFEWILILSFTKFQAKWFGEIHDFLVFTYFFTDCLVSKTFFPSFPLPPFPPNVLALSWSFYFLLQVKNFGRSGRTKYTHLVDQDTTQFESPWVSDTAMNIKFHNQKGGGMKQTFERPSQKKKKWKCEWITSLGYICIYMLLRWRK
jgi:hypothetical protein